MKTLFKMFSLFAVLLFAGSRVSAQITTPYPRLTLTCTAAPSFPASAHAIYSIYPNMIGNATTLNYTTTGTQGIAGPAFGKTYSLDNLTITWNGGTATFTSSDINQLNVLSSVGAYFSNDPDMIAVLSRDSSGNYSFYITHI